MPRALLLSMLFLISYRGQTQTIRKDTAVPKKLQLKKVDLYKPTTSANLPSQKKDSVRSIVYIGPKSKDTLRSLIPPVQKQGKSDIKIKTGADRYPRQKP